MPQAPLFERPLLATEHTEFDTGAERVALALAAHCALPLAVVMPVFDNAVLEVEAPELALRADAAAADKLRRLHDDAAAQGVALDVRVRHGQELYREIVDEATRRRSDLIVIRRRGRRGFLSQLMMGEMVGQVVAHAPCSVLVNARGAQMWAHRVLVGVDPAAPTGDAAVRAARLAAACALPLSLLVVAESPSRRHEAQDALDAALPRARALVTPVDGSVRVGKAADEIVAAASAAGADLIVLGRQALAHAGRQRVGAVVRQVISQAECPVLVLD